MLLLSSTESRASASLHVHDSSNTMQNRGLSNKYWLWCQMLSWSQLLAMCCRTLLKNGFCLNLPPHPSRNPSLALFFPLNFFDFETPTPSIFPMTFHGVEWIFSCTTQCVNAISSLRHYKICQLYLLWPYFVREFISFISYYLWIPDWGYFQFHAFVCNLIFINFISIILSLSAVSFVPGIHFRTISPRSSPQQSNTQQCILYVCSDSTGI